MVGQYAVQQSSAGRARQRVWQPPDLTLLRIALGGFTNAFTIGFGYPTPDARVLLKISILFYQEVTGQASQNLIPFDVTNGGVNSFGLSLQEADKVATGAYVPTVNIVGAGRNVASMQQIPLVTNAPFTVDNLNGFSLDIQGGQDAIVGTFASTGTFALPKGLVVVSRGRYNLVQAEMCDDEWEAAKQQMSPFNSPAVFG